MTTSAAVIVSELHATTRDELDGSYQTIAQSKKKSLSVARYRSETTDLGRTSATPVTDVFMAVVMLGDFLPTNSWCDGRQVPVPMLKPGTLSLYDFRGAWSMDLRQPFHTVNFFVPQEALDQLADDFRAPKFGLCPAFAAKHEVDQTMYNLAVALGPALDRPDEANRVFIDHVTTAVHLHLANAYGGLKGRDFPIVGGLSLAQETRAKEILAADLRGEVGISELAEACGMSTAHFARSFKATTGLPPHRWLMEQRIRKAKDLLRNTRRGLGEIAVTCGFASQSHFTRVFGRLVGTTPGIWRQESSLGGILFEDVGSAASQKEFRETL